MDQSGRAAAHLRPRPPLGKVGALAHLLALPPSTPFMRSKDLLTTFMQAPWRATTDLSDWTESIGPQPPAVVEQMLEILVDEAANEDRLNARRQTRRLRAFEQVLEASKGQALFSTLAKFLPLADAALREVIAAGLLQCNDASQHPRLVALFSHADASVRDVAAQTLLELESPTAFPHLIDIVKNPRLAGRKEAVDLMCHLGGQRALTGLVAVLRQGRDEDRAHAVGKLASETFVSHNRAAILDTLRTLFADPSDAVVVKAVEVYAQLCDASLAHQNLVPGLASPRIPVVQAIVRALARFPSTATLALLEQRFAAGPLAVRLAVLETCETIGDDRVVPIVFDALASGQGAVREAAAGIFSRLGSREDVDIHRAIDWLLRNPEASVRRRAVEVAAHADDPRGTLWRRLLPGLSDPDWWVRERAVDVVTERAGPDLLTEIESILRGSDPVARVYALDICERLQTPEALRLLVDRAKEDEEMAVRDRAIEGLGAYRGDATATMVATEALRQHESLALTAIAALQQLGAIESADIIAEKLKSPNSAVVTAALRALDVFDDKRTAPNVEECLTHRNARIRQHAAELLERWSQDPLSRADATGDRGGLDALLRDALDADASTLILAGGARPLLKHNHANAVVGEAPLSKERIHRLILPLLSPHQRARIDAGFEADASYAVFGERFRVHVFGQREGLTAVFHRSHTKIEALQTLGLPSAVGRAAKWRDGLVILAGDPRSGRSTTLHAIIDQVNAASTRHVILLSPSLEVVHPPKKSVVTQREIGSHAAKLQLALRASLRQDPDVIALDDVPGEDALNFALSAAETGHLVLCTLTAQSAPEAIERLLAATADAEMEHARAKLATSLRAVIYQRLFPRSDGAGRVAASELLLRTPAVSALIRKGKVEQLASAITTGHKDGMVTLERDMERLVKEGAIATS